MPAAMGNLPADGAGVVAVGPGVVPDEDLFAGFEAGAELGVGDVLHGDLLLERERGGGGGGLREPVRESARKVDAASCLVAWRQGTWRAVASIY